MVWIMFRVGVRVRVRVWIMVMVGVRVRVWVLVILHILVRQTLRGFLLVFLEPFLSF